MDLVTIRAALKTWAAAQMAIPAIWRDEPEDYIEIPRAKLHIISSNGVGEDELRYAYDEGADPGEDFQPTVAGARVFTLSVLVESDDQVTETARKYLEKLRTSLQKPSVKEAFKTAGFAYNQAEAVIDPPRPMYDEYIESVSSLDILFNTVSNETDTDEVGSFVEKATVTGHLYDPGGVDITWIDDYGVQE